MLALTKNWKIIRGDMPALAGSQLQAVIFFPSDAGFIDGEGSTVKLDNFFEYMRHLVLCRFHRNAKRFEAEDLFYEFMKKLSLEMKDKLMATQPLSESQIELEIEQSNPTAPRLTPDIIDSKIKKVEYHRLTERMTLCILTLENGTEVTGESFCACPENYVQKTGEDVAYKNARNRIWELEGYLLRESIYGSKNPALDHCLSMVNELQGNRIIINGEIVIFTNDGSNKISYEWLVVHAFLDKPVSTDLNYTVTWCSKENGRDGSLISGESVPAEDGLIFNVAMTGGA